MGFDLYAECERAKFLDWIENNKEELIRYLLLEEEELLLKLYKEGL